MTMPAYQFPQYAPPGYPQPAPAYPQMPPQQYAPPQQFPPAYAAPAQPAAPLATGSLDDFYSQPSTGGGVSLKFETPGTTYVGIITRPLTNGDVQQQTNPQGQPLTYKDGRPKFVMRVPLQIQPTPTIPDGLATWYVKGQARDELVRAMSEAGAPVGPPEAGAIVQVTFVGTRPSGAGFQPSKQFSVKYARPNGAAPVSAAPPAMSAEPAPAPQPAPVYVPDFAAQQAAAMAQVPAAPAIDFAALQAQQAALAAAQTAAAPAPVAPQAPAAPQVAAPVQTPVSAAPAQPQPPAGLSADQQALLAKLTGAGA